MQAFCNHLQVVAQNIVRHLQWHLTATIQQRKALEADLTSLPSGLYRRVMILFTICSGRPIDPCIRNTQGSPGIRNRQYS